jgi:hypothetical protein
LQEWHAKGGSDQLQYLYVRFVSYFLQLTPDDFDACTDAAILNLAGRGAQSAEIASLQTA